jgi:hypothetical protein
MGNETIINAFQTTLASNYVSGSGTALLTSATGLPASSSATYTLGIFSASDATAPAIVLLRVSARSGTTVTVAAEGTDTSAPSGSIVIAVESALAISTYVSENGGSATPGGSSGQIQYNNSSAFGGFTMSGDVTVNTGTGAATLAASGVTAATYGDSTHVAQIAVDAKGRVTSASNVAVSGGGGGGALVLLEQHTASASTSLDFTTCISSTYDEYIIEVLNLLNATDGTNIVMRVSTDGGSTYVSSASYSNAAYRFIGTAAAAGTGPANTSMGIDGTGGADTLKNTATYGLCGTYRLFNPGSASLYKRLVGTGSTFAASSSELEGFTVTSAYLSATAVNAFQFLALSGNLASGTVRVYGVAKS